MRDSPWLGERRATRRLPRQGQRTANEYSDKGCGVGFLAPVLRVKNRLTGAHIVRT
jgi:hypothetical protein